MNIFSHIVSAMIVGLMFVGVGLGFYLFMWVLMWLVANGAYFCFIALILFTAGTLSYLLRDPYI